MIKNKANITIIIEQSGIPVVVDAGIGVPSEAAEVMELGADCVLVNTAIALAEDPALMAEAFKLGVQAGRKAFEAGRCPPCQMKQDRLRRCGADHGSGSKGPGAH